jgi:hypothetical protein
MKNDSNKAKQKGMTGQFGDDSILLNERSVYIEGIKVLQKQERISYFMSLIISLVLIILLFIVLVIA